MIPKWAPKWTPKGVQKVNQKNDPKNDQKREQHHSHHHPFDFKKSRHDRKCSGPSGLKTSYFEDVPKMASRLHKIAQKRSQNDPKMDQDCFKLVKIPPKRPKIVPSGSTKGPKMIPSWFKIALNCPRYIIYIYL